MSDKLPELMTQDYAVKIKNGEVAMLSRSVALQILALAGFKEIQGNHRDLTVYQHPATSEHFNLLHRSKVIKYESLKRLIDAIPQTVWDRLPTSIVAPIHNDVESGYDANRDTLPQRLFREHGFRNASFLGK